MPAIQPVILSGGSGTRLWPASRATYPKQLLPLLGERTMLQATAERLAGKSGVSERTLVICNDAHRFLVAEQLAATGTPADIVLEPEGRNTAPAAALAALLATREGGEAPLLLIMPADHVIEDVAAFLEAVDTGAPAAAEGKLVMFGVVPSYPHTGYGYIEAEARDGQVGPIRSFVEKPDQKTAVRLLETNRFFWNSGIFLFRADTYLEELESYEPEMVAACRESIEKAVRDGDPELPVREPPVGAASRRYLLNRGGTPLPQDPLRQEQSLNAAFIRPDAAAFARSPSNSIDYAVMERTGRGAMVPMAAGWSDVGSWSALHEVSPRDADDNAIVGDVVALNCRGSYLKSGSRLVAAVGLKNVVVVEDRDAVLVAHKDQSQGVKALVDTLKSAGRAEAGSHRRVPMPWGSDDCVDEGEGYRVRRLVLNPGAELSAAEAGAGHWVVVRGTARVGRSGDDVELAAGEAARIVAADGSRIANAGQEPLHLVAVECGEGRGSGS